MSLGGVGVLIAVRADAREVTGRLITFTSAAATSALKAEVMPRTVALIHI